MQLKQLADIGINIITMEDKMKIKVSILDKKTKKVIYDYDNWSAEIDESNPRLISQFINELVSILQQDKKNFIYQVYIEYPNHRKTTYCYTIREYYYFCSGMETMLHIMLDN